MNVSKLKGVMDSNYRRVCIFVASSDNTKDVFKNVMASYGKFWVDCRYRKYLGLNSHDEEINNQFTIITVQPDGWRAELLGQIRLLPSDISHILLMLDDFLLLSPVDGTRLDSLIDEALKKGYNYTRLVPMYSALLIRLIRRFKSSVSGKVFEEIMKNEVYFSSLQPALWQREHLVAMLELPGTIWEFEAQCLPNARHYAISHTPPIICQHVVEKGKWMPDALLHFKCLGLPFILGGRPKRPSIEIPLVWCRRFKFAIIGYTGVRVRRMLAMASTKASRIGRSK
jgi:hypothetical protein